MPGSEIQHYVGEWTTMGPWPAYPCSFSNPGCSDHMILYRLENTLNLGGTVLHGPMLNFGLNATYIDSRRLPKASRGSVRIPEAPEGYQRLPEASERLQRLPEAPGRLPEGSQRLPKALRGSRRLPEAPEGPQRLPKAPRDPSRSLKLPDGPRRTWTPQKLEPMDPCGRVEFRACPKP